GGRDDCPPRPVDCDERCQGTAVTRRDVLLPALVPPASDLLGWPCGSPADAAPGTIEVLGVPSDAGNSIASGARFGPEAIRRACLGLTPPAIRGIDRGDLGT